MFKIINLFKLVLIVKLFGIEIGVLFIGFIMIVMVVSFEFIFLFDI